MTAPARGWRDRSGLADSGSREAATGSLPNYAFDASVTGRSAARTEATPNRAAQVSEQRGALRPPPNVSCAGEADRSAECLAMLPTCRRHIERVWRDMAKLLGN